VVVLDMHVEVGLSGTALVTEVTLEASHVFVHDQLVTIKVTMVVKSKFSGLCDFNLTLFV